MHPCFLLCNSPPLPLAHAIRPYFGRVINDSCETGQETALGTALGTKRGLAHPFPSSTSNTSEAAAIA
jgi:hypothetical protein